MSVDEKIVELYRKGLSIRQIQVVLGFSRGWIHGIVKKAGASRSRSEANRLAKPCNTPKTSRAYRKRARKLVRKALNRELLPLEEVHHRDLDYTNNDISNLILLTKAQHERLHREVK